VAVSLIRTVDKLLCRFFGHAMRKDWQLVSDGTRPKVHVCCGRCGYMQMELVGIDKSGTWVEQAVYCPWA